MDATPDTPPAAPVPEPGAAAGLSGELAALRARVEALERALQLREAAAAAGLAGPLPAPAPPAASLPLAFAIAADELLPAADGFYRLEWGPEGAFRWTGPAPEVRFEAWIDRSAPLVATLRLFHFGVPANAKDLVLEVDGEPHPLTRRGSEKVLVSPPIPPRPTEGPTPIVLRVPHVHSPSARGLPDKRMLGVAFQSLRLDRA
jgi:hypothetical protein